MLKDVASFGTDLGKILCGRERVNAELISKELEPLFHDAGAQEHEVNIVPVLALIGAPASSNIVMGANGAACYAAIVPVHRALVLETYRHLVLGNIEAFALSGLFCPAKRSDDICKAAQAGQIISGNLPCSYRLHAGEALHGHAAGKCLADRVIASAIHVVRVTALAIARIVGNDKPGIPGPQHFISQAPLLIRTAL